MTTLKKKYNKACAHKQEILELRKQGLTLREIGEKFGLTKSQVHYEIYSRKEKRVVPKVEVKIPPSIGEEKIQRINKLANWGYKAFEISEDVSLPTSLVHQVVSNLRDSNKIQKRV